MSSNAVVEGQYDSLLEAAALSSSPITEPFYVGGFRTANVAVSLTHDAATEVTMECYVAFPSDDTAWFKLQNVNTAGDPLYTSEDAVWTKAVSGDAAWIWRIPTDCTRMKLAFSATAPGADAIDVSVRVDAG